MSKWDAKTTLLNIMLKVYHYILYKPFQLDFLIPT